MAKQAGHQPTNQFWRRDRHSSASLSSASASSASSSPATPHTGGNGGGHGGSRVAAGHNTLIKVHFLGWHSKWNQWIDLRKHPQRIQPRNSMVVAWRKCVGRSAARSGAFPFVFITLPVFLSATARALFVLPRRTHLQQPELLLCAMQRRA